MINDSDGDTVIYDKRIMIFLIQLYPEEYYDMNITHKVTPLKGISGLF